MTELKRVSHAAHANHAGRANRKDCAAAILYAAENATKAALNAIQLLGGNGYTNEYPTGRYLRDAKLYEIGAGTSGESPGSLLFLLLPTGQFTDAAMESCWWQLRGDVAPSSPCSPPLQRSGGSSLAGSCSSRHPEGRVRSRARVLHPAGCMPSAEGGSSRWWLGDQQGLAAAAAAATTILSTHASISVAEGRMQLIQSLPARGAGSLKFWCRGMCARC